LKFSTQIFLFSLISGIFFACSPEPKNDDYRISSQELIKFTESILEFNHFTKEEFTDNYDSNEEGFTGLISFFDSIVPSKAEVTVEFSKNNELEIFHVKVDSFSSYNWHVKMNSEKCDSLLEILDWKNNELEIIKSRLNTIDCISIANSSKHKIGYKRDGMGIYYYKIYKEDLTASEIENCDNCITIFHRNNVVLEYGSGAIGSTCFPERFK
jgi:hypothetical protein